MNIAKLVPCLLSVLLITACDRKEILSGKREVFFEQVDSAEVDKGLFGVSVSIPPAVTLNSYLEENGNSRRNLVNCKLNQTLKTAWKTSIRGGAGTNLVVQNGKIYLVNTDGELLAIDEKTGALLWTNQIYYSKDGVPFEGGLALAEGYLFVTTNDGQLLKIDLKAPTKITKYNLKLPLKGSPVVQGNNVFVTTIDNKTVALQTDLKGKFWDKTGFEEETIMSGAGTPAVFNNSLICAYSNGDVVSIDMNTGTELWTDTLLSGDTSESGFVISHIVASPVISGDKVLVSTSESKTVLVDAKSGVRIWEKTLGAVNPPVIVGGWTFLLSNENSLKCLSMADGSVKWSHSFSSKSKMFGPLLINGNVVVFSDQAIMTTINPKTGQVISSVELGGSISKTPIVVNSSLYVVGFSDLVCLK